MRISDFLCSISFFNSYQHGLHPLGIERYQWIKIIAFAVYSLVCTDQNQNQYNAANVSPNIKQCRQNEKNDSHELKCISQFVITLSEIGNSDKCGIQYYLRDQPSDIDRKISKDKSAYY